jgi:hypothetical protein
VPASGCERVSYTEEEAEAVFCCWTRSARGEEALNDSDTMFRWNAACPCQLA